MDISLELAGHCIETSTKKKYEHLLRYYLKKTTSKPEKQGLEDSIEGLRFFLEYADFSYLRNDFPELNGNPHLTVILKIPENHSELVICFENKRIQPKWNG